MKIHPICGTHPLPLEASPDCCAYTELSKLVVIPRSLSDVDHPPACPWRLVSTELSDDCSPASVTPPDSRDQSIDRAQRQEKLERATCHFEGEDVGVSTNTDQLRGQRHPITRVPPEILAYVFELFVAPMEEFMTDDAPTQGPLYLAQVCTLWKAIVESDPRLWTSVHFCFAESHVSRNGDVQRVKQVLNKHLKYSGALLISLTFADYRAFHYDTKGLIYLLANRIRTHARRWKRISFQLAGGYFSSLFTFTPCDLSSLEHLSINGNSVLFRPSIALQLNLQSATNLKSFSYNGPGPSMEDDIDLDWERLTEVAFGFAPHYGASSTSYWRFRDLAQCRNITTCSLGVGRPPPFDSSQTITLPCLQTLRIRRLTPYSHGSGVIHPLVLPRLQTLEIETSALFIWSQSWYDRTFSNLLARSGCDLLHLSIQDVKFPNDELIRCLALSPALTSLRFIPCPRSQDITDVIRRLDVSYFARQRRRKRRHAAVPQLCEITLASSAEACLESMMDMFRSRVGERARAAGVATLRRVEVVFFDMWHDTEADRARGSQDRLERVAGFPADLMQWVSETKGENETKNGQDELEASVVVDSPYLPKYIHVQ